MSWLYRQFIKQPHDHCVTLAFCYKYSLQWHKLSFADFAASVLHDCIFHTFLWHGKEQYWSILKVLKLLSANKSNLCKGSVFLYSVDPHSGSWISLCTKTWLTDLFLTKPTWIQITSTRIKKWQDEKRKWQTQKWSTVYKSANDDEAERVVLEWPDVGAVLTNQTGLMCWTLQGDCTCGYFSPQRNMVYCTCS